MRDPNAFNHVDNSETPDIIKLDNIPEYDIQDYDLMDEKDFKKYIFDIERICRYSIEYKNYVKFLRDNMQMNECSFYRNVTNADTFKIKIHIHHDPFDLYSICVIVVNKRLQHRESVDPELVAKEVMFLHYKLLVGLIPLAETPHELVHNNYLFIPLDMVLGKYYEFYNLYEPYMLPEQIEKYNEILEATRTLRLNTEILDKKYLYLDMTGEYKLPPLEKVVELLEQSKRDNSISFNISNNNNDNNLERAIEFV